MAGIYFHIPFCKRICAYCDFFKSAELKHIPAVLEAMHRELDRQRDYLGGEPVTTLYFGGGTPSLLSPADIDGLLRHTRDVFDCSHITEATLEANPDDLDAAYLAAIRRTGIGRLSMGIQSFDDACLKLMNRRHNAAQAEAAVKAARAAGFDNLSIDIIFGVPGFGGDSLARTLDKACSLDAEHISAYHLTIEPATAFGRKARRGDFSPVAEQVSEAEFLQVHRTFTAAGYSHYEISNFARPGFRARHNSSYWHGVKYLGIGPAAHSYDGNERHWNPASLERYTQGELPEAEQLTPTDRYNEYLMTHLRTIDGIRLDEVERRFGPLLLEELRKNARLSLAAGTLTLEDGALKIPPEKFLLSDAVISELFHDTEEGTQEC